MLVCVVHNEYAEPSGEEVAVEDICRGLRNHGQRVLRVTRRSAGINRNLFGLGRAFCSGIYSPGERRSMQVLLRQEKPDVVHVNNLFPLISPSILPECRNAGVPVVMTVHNFRLVCPNGLHYVHGEVCERCCGGREYWCAIRNCEGNSVKSIGYALRNYVARRRRWFLDNVTLYLALTEFQRNRLVGEGFPGDRIVVLPNSVPACDATCSEAPAPGEYVAFVGRLSSEKGVGTLLNAARACSDVPFRIAGSKSHSWSPRAQPPDNVEFVGRLESDALHQFYTLARIVVFPSLCFEGCPKGLLEAMMHKKPIICSRIGGLPEIVREGKTGFLVEPGDAIRLQERIRYLWKRPRLCRQMGAAGYAVAVRDYSEERSYRCLMAAYQEAIELGRRS